MAVKQWNGPAPTECDLCAQPIRGVFVDGATRQGPWAIMCNGCASSRGVGLGAGRGQQYKLAGGKWLKVAG